MQFEFNKGRQINTRRSRNTQGKDQRVKAQHILSLRCNENTWIFSVKYQSSFQTYA